MITLERTVGSTEDTRQIENAKDQIEKQHKENLKILLYATVGLLISSASFWLHFHFGKMAFVTAVICIADVAYAFWHARIFFSKNWKWEKHIVTSLILICYWALVFGLVCAVNALTLKVPFSYAFFLYPVFLMPSFVIVFVVVCLVLTYM